MKRIITILLAVIVALGVSACNKATTQKEVDKTTNDNEIPVSTEEATDKTTDKTIEKTSCDKISAYMEEESRKAFSPYYELIDFQISDYQEEVVDGNVEAIFSYKLINKNYDKDPDTVEYIKEAKESGNKNYQLMFDEYLQPKEMNFHLKVIIDENDQITLYSNISPNGIEWEETRMTDFILK